MAVEVDSLDDDDPRCVELRLSGKLHSEDYEFFVPIFDEMVDEYGKLRLLICMREFHGWDLAALWQELKFDLKHLDDFDLLAVVGDKQWEKWMTTFTQPFTSAEVRYFDMEQYAKAKDWILHGEKTKADSGTSLEATPM